jgi:hypothetical protein
MEEELKGQEQELSDDIANLNKKVGSIISCHESSFTLLLSVEVPGEAIQRCTIPTSRYCEFLINFLERWIVKRLK